MMTFVRTIVDLPTSQLEALDALCRRDRISRAEAVRRAVAQLVQRERAVDRDQAFGIWRDRRVDGLHYQARLRREWDARK